MFFPSQTVLITGASSGIGYELAKLFAKEGSNLILVSRNLSRLSRIADQFQKDFGISVRVLSKDLSAPDAPQQIFEELNGESVSVDILVNNAGFGVYGKFHDSQVHDQIKMLQLNIIALTHLTHLFLPGMINRKRGKIMNVASTAAFQPGPLMSTYFAAKAYVLSFSEAVAFELRNSGVDVSAFCPGPTKTEFQKRAGTENIRESFFNMMSAKKAAAIGFDGLKKRKTIIVPGLLNKLQIFFIRFFPRKWIVAAAHFVESKSQCKASTSS